MPLTSAPRYPNSITIFTEDFGFIIDDMINHGQIAEAVDLITFFFPHGFPPQYAMQMNYLRLLAEHYRIRPLILLAQPQQAPAIRRTRSDDSGDSDCKRQR